MTDGSFRIERSRRLSRNTNDVPRTALRRETGTAVNTGTSRNAVSHDRSPFMTYSIQRRLGPSPLSHGYSTAGAPRNTRKRRRELDHVI